MSDTNITPGSRPFCPAAAYVRMSTDRQDQSIALQLDYIGRYAAATECTVIRVYRDEAKSGLTVNHRPGLQRLIADIEAGSPGFEVLLVYDVSRWGRFQDVDESAYYEFLCRRSGVRVVYCAEHFAADESPLTHLMKDVKRLMAAEHSRQLSVKVFDAHVHLLRQGCKPGGIAGYGLRRLCLRSDGSVRRILEDGERKAHPTDRVVFAPGPEHEVTVVRLIFNLYNELHLSYRGLARKLNADGIVDGRGQKWSETKVRAILTNPKYCGILAYNRTTAKLGTKRRKNDSSEWIIREEAHKPLVSPQEFVRAQLTYSVRHGLAPDLVLEKLSEIYQREGRLTYRLIDAEPGLPHVELIKKMFGSLYEAYELAIPSLGSHISQAKRLALLQQMRNRVCELVALSEHSLSSTRNPFVLCLDGRLTLHLAVVSCSKKSGYWGWRIPSRATGSDFVLSGLLRCGGKGIDSYALLKTSCHDCLHKWLNVDRVAHFDALVYKSIEQLFGV